MVEEGAYRRLLDQYYIREKPLPADARECCRLARAVSKPEQKAVEYVLGQFFELGVDGYRQGRTDREIRRYVEKRATAKANSVLGVEARRAKANGHANGYSFDQPGGQPNGTPNGLSPQSPVPSPQSPQDNPTPTPPKGGAGFGRRSPARAEKDQALEVWNRLTGSNGAEPPRDSRLQAAIDAVGGWTRIAQRERGIDDQRVRQDFVEAYRGAS